MNKKIILIILIVLLLILIWACGFIRNEIVNQTWLKELSEGEYDNRWFDICYGFSFAILFSIVIGDIIRRMVDERK